MTVKVPPLLHKMSLASQKAWYKKHGMEMPATTAVDGKSAAKAKKDVGEINKKKAREAAIAAAAAASKKNKELVASSERVRQMAANVKAFGGQRPGGDLTTASGMVNFIRSGGYLKAGRLGEESVNEADRVDLIKRAAVANRMGKSKFLSKVNARAAQLAQQKRDDKITKSKVNFGMSNEPFPSVKVSQSVKEEVQIDEVTKKEVAAVIKTKDVNKQKLKNYVRGLGTKAVIAGKVPFDQVHSPLRAGRKALKQEEKKPDASMAMTHQLKMKMISDKDKRTLGKVADLMAAQKKKVKEEVELDEVTKQEAEKALGGPVKTRTGTEPKGKLPLGFRAARNLARKAMKKGAPVTEGYEYTNIGHPPEHSVDVDPMPASDPLKLATKRKKPVQYKSGMKDGVRIREESTEETKMNKGRLLAKAIMAKQSKHAMSQNMGEAVKDAADVGEYDYEGDMAKSQLRSILTHAKRLHDMLEDQDNLPEWVQSKITLAQDYVLTAADYMEGEMNEEVEVVDEKVEIFHRQGPGADMERYHKDTSNPAAVLARKKAADAAKTSRVAGDLKAKKMGQTMSTGNGGAVKAVSTTSQGFKKEEVVTEAEGTVAVTPKEKALAAHHGDKSKITYGDVIKARIKSAAAKAMNKGK